jgi:hypothetical protein
LKVNYGRVKMSRLTLENGTTISFTKYGDMLPFQGIDTDYVIFDDWGEGELEEKDKYREKLGKEGKDGM